MNRNKSPNTAENTNSRKRRLKSPESKEPKSEEKTKTTPTTNEADEDDYEEQEESYRNRKSLRIKNKSQSSVTPTSGVTPKKGKESPASMPATSLVSTPLTTSITPAAKQKVTSNTSTTSSSASSSSSSENRKLNGAQFVAAAAAGNFNVSASIGSTSITIDSNSNQDLTQLNHNVEVLTKTIAQHSILLKQLNGSIEKLSSKIDLAKSATKRLTAKSKQAVTTTKQTSRRHKHNDVDLNDSLDERITLDDSQAEEEEDENESEKDDEHETINSKSQQLAQQQHHKQQQQEINDLVVDNETPAAQDASQLKTELVIKENDKSPVKQLVASSAVPSASQTPTQVNELNNVVNEPVTQTVKLTNIESISEENPRQSANAFYYLSDSSKSDDDDDDDDDDDEDDDGNEENFQENQEGKKSKRSSHGQKSPTKAILNKTKIDTEFISKLIANKDPNDKRYDPNEINKLRLLSHSYQNFAVKLLIRLFDEDEIIGRNVYGRNYSGDKSFMKQPLDPERINFIKETVLKLTKTNNPELAWASCVIAMNRKMVDINNKFIKNHKNSTNNAANNTI